MQPTTAPRGHARRTHTEALAEQLYADHRRRLLTIARRNSDDPDEAEEALHDAFILFIEHFDPDAGTPPLAWLTLTLKRRCWALYRRRRWLARLPHSTAPASAAARSPEEAIEIGDELERWNGRLARLKPAERRVLLLIALGYRYSEICAITNWSYTKVNRCATEGRSTLRALAHGGE